MQGARLLKIISIGLFCFIALFIFSVQNANAVTTTPDKLPAPVTFHRFTSEDLTAEGCQKAKTSERGYGGGMGTSSTTVDNVTFPDNWIHVKPSDRADHDYWFCPPQAVENFKSRDTDEEPVGTVSSYFIELLNGVITIVANIGLFLLYISSAVLGKLITVGSFIKNGFVQSGWPIVQGIANLGFIIALVFIALATTLGIESYGARKMLPRLLIAALLINFSLVIGGIIIDASRLSMAIFYKMMTQNSQVTDIGYDALKSSHILTGVFREATFMGINGVKSPAASNYWSIPFDLLAATILIWGLALGFFILSVGLVVRYIALILLLTVSPIAYLAFAFPGADKWAKQWWSNFLKWVFYGPIVLFILVLLVQVEGTAIRDSLGKFTNSVLANVMNIGVTTALLIFANKAGKSLGGMGGAAAVDFATKRGKQAARWGYNNPGKAAAIVASTATGGIGYGLVAAGGVAAGSTKLGRTVLRPADDMYKTAKAGVKNRLKASKATSWIVGSERDEKGNLKKGQESWASGTTKYVMGKTGFDPKEAKRQAEYQTAQSMPIPTMVNSARKTVIDQSGMSNEQKTLLTVPKLRDANVLKGLGTGKVETIVTYADDPNQIKSIMTNDGFVESLKDDDIQKILEAIKNNNNITDKAKSSATSSLFATLQRIASKK